MSEFDPRDYDGATFETEASDRDNYAERMQSFDAGLCSLRAVHQGGAMYQREMAETALELSEAGIADAIAVPVAGWLASLKAGRRAAWKLTPEIIDSESFERDYASDAQPKRSARSSRMKSGCASASQEEEIDLIEAANGWAHAVRARRALPADDLDPETGCTAAEIKGKVA